MPPDPMKSALRRLAMAESMAAEAQRIAGVGTWHYDIASGFVIWSDELFRIYGRSPETFVPSAEEFLGIVHPDDRAPMLAVIEATAHGDPMDIVHRIVRPDGEIRYIHSRAQVVVLEKNGPLVMLGTAQDITERREAEKTIAEQTAQLKEMQAELIYLARQSAMGTMAATLAHELNQPLSAISNYAAGLMNTMPSDPHVSLGLGEILKNIERAGEVIRHIRIMTKRGTSKRETVEITAVIEGAVALLTGSDCWQNELECRFGGNYVVKADPVQIGQVVINLLKNACEAVDGQAVQRVLLETSMHDDQVRTAVTDSGPGIEAELFTNLFEGRESMKARGMGVGLSISRTIVESHGGKIGAENLADGGAFFWFSLPSVEPSP